MKKVSSSDIISHIDKMRGYMSDAQVIDYFEKSVLAAKNPELSCWFALNIKGADVLAHGQVVIKSKDPKYNYVFAKKLADGDVRYTNWRLLIDYDSLLTELGTEIRAHCQAVIESGDPEYNYLCAKDIKGADIPAHKKAIEEGPKPEYNYRCALNIEEADIPAHKKAIEEGPKSRDKKRYLKKISALLSNTEIINQKILSLKPKEFKMGK